MGFATPDELSDLWASAGLSDVEVQPVEVSAGYTGFENLWEPMERRRPSGAYVVSLSPKARA